MDEAPAPAPAEPRAQWWVYGANVFRRDAEDQGWRQVTTLAEAPAREALFLYHTSLLDLPDPAAYEWTEGGVHYRMERWSDRALEVARVQAPALFPEK